MNSLPDHAPGQSSPIVRAAVTALDAFGALDRDDADVLLHSWARRHELTPDDRRAVLDHYPDDGYGYSRPVDPEPGRVPDGVEGHQPTGRESEPPWA